MIILLICFPLKFKLCISGNFERVLALPKAMDRWSQGFCETVSEQGLHGQTDSKNLKIPPVVNISVMITNLLPQLTFPQLQ